MADKKTWGIFAAIAVALVLVAGFAGANWFPDEVDIGKYSDGDYEKLQETLSAAVQFDEDGNLPGYIAISDAGKVDGYVPEAYALTEDEKSERDAYTAITEHVATNGFIADFVDDNEDWLVEYFELEDDDDLDDYDFEIRAKSEKYADFEWDSRDNIDMEVPVIIDWETDDDFGQITVENETLELVGEYENDCSLDDVEINLPDLPEA